MEKKIERLDKSYDKTILFIGASRACKTTLATNIAKKYGMTYLSGDVLTQLCKDYQPNIFADAKSKQEEKEILTEILSEPVLKIASMYQNNPNCPNLCIDSTDLTAESIDKTSQKILEATGFDPRSIIKVYCLGYPDVSPSVALRNVRINDDPVRDWSPKAEDAFLLKELAGNIKRARENRSYIENHSQDIINKSGNNEPWIEFVNVGSGIERNYALRKCMKNIDTFLNNHATDCQREQVYKKASIDDLKYVFNQTKMAVRDKATKLAKDFGLIDSMNYIKDLAHHEKVREYLFKLYKGIEKTNERFN